MRNLTILAALTVVVTAFGAPAPVPARLGIGMECLDRDLADPGIAFTSYFHLFDFDHYSHEVTYHYGVLRDKDYSRKPSFDVLKRVKQFFDDGFTVPDGTISMTLEHAARRKAPPSEDALVTGAAIYPFKRRGLPLFAVTSCWPAHEEMPPIEVKAQVFLGDSSNWQDPVILDLLSGKVRRLDPVKDWPTPKVRFDLRNHVQVITEALALEPYVKLPPRAGRGTDVPKGPSAQKNVE